MVEDLHMDSRSSIAREGRLIVFAGAGISMLPPTGLPSWRDVNKIIISSLAHQSASILGSDRASEAEKILFARHAQERLPPEFQAEILADILGQAYFEVLRHLDSDRPNAAHLLIASLARRGFVRAVLTTNFDRALEAAFQLTGTPYESHYSPEHLSTLANDLGRLSKPDCRCQLVKIHGSVDDPATLIDTLAQRKRGLSPHVVRTVRHLLHFGPWAFLGFSGLDLEAEPNYLCLAEESAHAAGFFWLVRQGTEARPAVQRLGKLYGDRGVIVSGNLPDWLFELADSLSAEIRPEIERFLASVPPAPADPLEPLRGGAAAWAKKLSSEACAIVVARLVDAAAEPKLSAAIWQAMLEAAPASTTALFIGRVPVSFQSIAAHGLGGQFMKMSRHREAVEQFSAALAAFDTSDSDGRDRCRRNMAQSLEQLGETRLALELYESALEGFRAREDAREAASVLNHIAGHHIRQEQYAEARPLAEEAMHNARLVGDEQGRIHALNNLGVIAQRLEDYPRALEIYAECEEVCHRLGSDGNAAIARANRADTLALLGRFEEAEPLYASALEEHERLAQHACRAEILSSLGYVARQRGDPETAATHLRAAREISQSIGDPANEAAVCHKLAGVLVDLGQVQEAADLDREALALLGESNPSLAGYLQAHLGWCCIKLGQLDAAAAAYRTSNTIATELSNLSLRATSAHQLGSVLLLQQKNVEATEAFEEAITLWRELQRPDDEARSRYSYAAVLLDRAVAALSDAGHTFTDRSLQRNAAHQMVSLYPTLIEIYRELSAAELVAHFASSAGSTCNFLGQEEEAAGWYLQAAQGFAELQLYTPLRKAFACAESIVAGKVRTLLTAGDPEKAVQTMRELAELAGELHLNEPRAAATYNAAMILCQSLKRYDEARAVASKLASELPADSNLLENTKALIAFCDERLADG